MNTKILVFFIFLFSNLTVWAAEKPSVKVEADHLRYSGNKNISVFEGNVIAYYQDIVINSDNMTVFFKKDKKVEKIICVGNVQITKGDIYSLSEYAEINIDSDNAVLKKNVKIWKGKNYLEGEEVVLYNNDDRIIVNKGDNSRVKIIFFPEGEDNGTKNEQLEKKIQE